MNMTLRIPAPFSLVLREQESSASAASSRHSWRWLWVAPIVLALLVTTAYPTLFILGLAATKSTLGRPFGEFLGITQVLSVLQDSVFVSALAKSIAYALAISVVQLVLGLSVALLLSSLQRTGRILLSLVLLPLMTAPVMVGVAWKLMLAPAGGLINGLLQRWQWIGEPISFLGSPSLAWWSIAVADIWQWTPFIVILSWAALATLPDGVRDAARVDGARPWQSFRWITLPLISAPLASIFLLKLILSFKLFDLVFVLTFGGPGFETTTAGFSIWRATLEEFDVGKAAAQTLVYAIVVGLVTLPVVKLQRRLEGGEQ